MRRQYRLHESLINTGLQAGALHARTVAKAGLDGDPSSARRHEPFQRLTLVAHVRALLLPLLGRI